MKHLALNTFIMYAITSLLSIQGHDQLSVQTSVSVGELLDKITILQIKQERVKSSSKLANIAQELTTLQNTFAATNLASNELTKLMDTLRTINEELWDLEDATRKKEAQQCHDTEFKQLAARIINRNDARARTKAAMNSLTNSAILEEKSYATMHATQRTSTAPSVLITIEVPFAELIDKITILEVKLAKIHDEQKRAHLTQELEILITTRDSVYAMTPELEAQTALLRTTNRTMFDIQDALRAHISKALYDDEFVRLARGVYFTNDERCRIKHTINELVGSHLIEEKEYAHYETSQRASA